MKSLTVVILGCALATFAGEINVDPLEGRSRLYTEPDPSSSGGITGRIVQPAQPIEQILATPPDAPQLVYKGTITGEDKQSFRFDGLPMRKYDLVVIYENALFEGLQLARGDNTLTAGDREKIDASIQKSEPYYPDKIIHRLEGETGRGNHARAICTFYLESGSELLFNTYEGASRREDPRRAFKLIILKDVGPGWQIERARDLYSKWASKSTLQPKHHFRPELSRIRVADSIKDLGELHLHP